MSKLKAGIIGLGVGQQHVAGYQRHPDCQVVALCDLSEEKLAAARQRYPGMRLTRRAEQVLEDPEIDVVSIASYDNHHFEQAKKAILGGKHVFVEKPVCVSQDQARQLRAVLNDHPQVRMSSNLILRMNPRFKTLKGMIAEGRFGELFCVEGDYNYGRLHKLTEGWRGTMDFYSVVYGGAVHMVDLLLWLTGDMVEEVAGYGNSICTRGSPFRYNDMVMCVLRFRSGMVGKVSANFGCVMPHSHGLSVYGTEATFVNGIDCGRLYESRDPSVEPQRIGGNGHGPHKGDLIYGFVDSILDRGQSEVTEEDVFRTMSVCLAMEKATHQRGPVAVEYV